MGEAHCQTLLIGCKMNQKESASSDVERQRKVTKGNEIKTVELLLYYAMAGNEL